MVKRVAFIITKIMLNILTPKIIYNNLYYFIFACHILKTKIITNKIYIKRLFTATRMHSCS